jgi:hypothetical protein
MLRGMLVVVGLRRRGTTSRGRERERLGRRVLAGVRRPDLRLASRPTVVAGGGARDGIVR